MTSCTCFFRMNRKPAWYHRAVKMATVWRSTISKSREISTKNATILWRSTAISRATTEIDHPTHASSNINTRSNNKLSKCSSLKIATTTFTRVCLCAPISSYKELNFRAEQIPPRRSNSYPRYSKSSTSTFSTSQDGVNYYNNIPATPRLSVEGRRVFRGKSLTDDVLMRRFVVEEEAMMQIRRRNQMEAIRRRSIMRRKNRDLRELQELFSKLNPMAKEFVPPSLIGLNDGFHANNLAMYGNNGNEFINGNAGRRSQRKNYNQGKRRPNTRTGLAQREESIRRTVYVSDIDQQVTEEQLAALFINCGMVVDCRICGDPNSVLRFAFIEFTDEESARAALDLSGTMLGFYPVRVLPSKTAIAPVNPTFLPRTEDEREICARTIYCTNIDKKVSQADVKLFFESVCGEVFRLRLLGDYNHSTRIAFVEFLMAESAIAALNCSGVILGSLPIRVSPSKTPVRPRAPRPPIH